MPHPLTPILLDLIRILEGHAVPYQVMGGMAIRVWSFPRATFDIDLTLSLEKEKLRVLIRSLEKEGYTVPEPFRSGFLDRLRGMEKLKVQLYQPGRPPVDIDLFLVTVEYQRVAFGRRRLLRIGDRDVWFMSPEDLILHKLIAGRDRDLADVSDLLMAAAPLDLEYLRKWAGILGVTKPLEAKVREQEGPAGA